MRAFKEVAGLWPEEGLFYKKAAWKMLTEFEAPWGGVPSEPLVG